MRRHRAALLKFAELAGAAGVDAVVQASKPPSLPFHWQAWGGCLRGRSGRARPPARGLGAACTPAEERLGAGRSLPEEPPGGRKEDITCYIP